ncbi:hypothetical protein ACFWMR_01370 [Amycolatopsis thailandensis]|uniref:hypothetical protein n=1 Tax=Amycolatopsis thailandensis TaxID=589330 RepID=UPI003666216A
MTSSPHPSFAALGHIDWNDTTSILRGCTPVFQSLASDPLLLSALVAGIADDSHLADMCEGYDFMHKLVLYDATDLGVRLRLHVYREGFFDRPHNHRWSFASHILRGGYTHRIFGRDDQFGEDTDPDSLLPIHERFEQPGSTYALHHTSVHTVQAEADTISLLVRGPSAKQRFLIVDAAAGGFFWVYGAAQESPEQRASKRLTRDQLANTITRIQRLIADLDSASRSATLDGR